MRNPIRSNVINYQNFEHKADHGSVTHYKLIAISERPISELTFVRLLLANEFRHIPNTNMQVCYKDLDGGKLIINNLGTLNTTLSDNPALGAWAGEEQQYVLTANKMKQLNNIVVSDNDIYLNYLCLQPDPRMQLNRGFLIEIINFTKKKLDRQSCNLWLETAFIGEFDKSDFIDTDKFYHSFFTFDNYTSKEPKPKVNNIGILNQATNYIKNYYNNISAEGIAFAMTALSLSIFCASLAYSSICEIGNSLVKTLDALIFDKHPGMQR